VPARRLFFTEVASIVGAMAVADGAVGALGADGCSGAATSVATGGRPERSIPSIPSGAASKTKGRGKSVVAVAEELGHGRGRS
jgi:hypothetical protein